MELAPAIGTTFDYDIPMDQMLELIHESGFDHAAIGMRLDHSFYHTISGRNSLRALLDKWGTSIDSIHANYLQDESDIASLNENERVSGVNDFTEVIKATADLGCRIVVFHPHRRFEGIENIGTYKTSVLRSVETLIAESQSAGVTLAVENLFVQGSNEILDTLFTEFSDDELGFCYDSSHDNITKNTNFGDLFSQYSTRLLTTHLSDNMGNNDDHMIPFTADIDFSIITRQFPKDTYRGNILLEVESRMHPELKDFAAEFLRQSFDAAMRIRKEILNPETLEQSIE